TLICKGFILINNFCVDVNIKICFIGFNAYLSVQHYFCVYDSKTFDNMTILLVLFIAAICVNALIVAAEIAVSTFGENKIQEMKDEGDKTASLFEQFLVKQESVYGTI